MNEKGFTLGNSSIFTSTSAIIPAFDFAISEIKLGVMVLDASDFYVDSSRLRQEMQILSVTKIQISHSRTILSEIICFLRLTCNIVKFFY